jgi:hypothetical protein
VTAAALATARGEVPTGEASETIDGGVGVAWDDDGSIA